jgi:hypothetical protein
MIEFLGSILLLHLHIGFDLQLVKWINGDETTTLRSNSV